MSALQTAFRILTRVMQHPNTKRLANHILRLATAELVRHIQNKTRGRTTVIHYS